MQGDRLAQLMLIVCGRAESAQGVPNGMKQCFPVGGGHLGNVEVCGPVVCQQEFAQMGL